MQRRNAYLITILLLALPVLVPAAAEARTHHASSKQVHRTAAKKSQPRKAEHVRREVRAAAKRHHREPVVERTRLETHRETRRHPVLVRREAIARHEVRREHTPIPPEVIAELPPSPVRGATGVAHPPDLDDDAPENAPPAEAASTHPAEESAPLRSVEEEAAAPQILPTLYNRNGHLIMPPPLRGSHEILVHQNLVADRDGLTRIQDDADLERMRREGLLVALPVNAGLQVDERLPGNRRYCRPWVAQFLVTMARAHYARFHTPLQVNSAVRTVDFQLRLMRTNGNAAPAEGDTASPHLTGQAIDIAKHGLSMTEIAWMRSYLLPWIQQGKIDVEEEFQQSCFHISVYRRYEPSTSAPRRSIASGRRGSATSLAVALP